MATIAVILLYVSTSEAVWEEFVAPFRSCCWDARLYQAVAYRRVYFLPLLVGWYFSSWAAGGVQPPGGLRVIHPTPPASVSFKGKRMVLKEIPTNPLRADKGRLAEHIEQGRQVYYKNCFSVMGMVWRAKDTMPRVLTRRLPTSRMPAPLLS